MQGSQFHIDLIKRDLADVITDFQDSAIPVYASMLDKSAKQLQDFEKVPQLALIIGNEAHGVSETIASLSDEKLEYIISELRKMPHVEIVRLGKMCPRTRRSSAFPIEGKRYTLPWPRLRQMRLLIMWSM